MLEDKYFKKLMEAGSLEASKSEIVNSVESTGKFTEYAEWRMGTCAEVKIEKKESNYRVNVTYDYEFTCTCPSIEKAIQMAGLFVQMLIKLDQQIGWPSNA